MLKIFKIFIPILVIGAIVGTPIGVQYFMSKNEIKDISYGSKVEVNGKKMNVVSSGEGEDVIVIYPTTFCPSPYYRYLPLTSELNKSGYKTLTIEPFGYGLSDDTDVAREYKEEVKELHTCLTTLGVSKYTLLLEDFSGIMGMAYANTYKEELNSVIGLDTVIPKLNSYYDFVSSLSFFNLPIEIFNNSGWRRIISLFNHGILYDQPSDYTYSKQDADNYRKLCLDRLFTENQKDEVEKGKDACKGLENTYIPKEVPNLQLVSTEYSSMITDMFSAAGKEEVTVTIEGHTTTITKEEAWEKVHSNPLNEHNQVEKIEGKHNLVASASKVIAEKIDAWKKSLV